MGIKGCIVKVSMPLVHRDNIYTIQLLEQGKLHFFIVCSFIVHNFKQLNKHHIDDTRTLSD